MQTFDEGSVDHLVSFCEVDKLRRTVCNFASKHENEGSSIEIDGYVDTFNRNECGNKEKVTDFKSESLKFRPGQLKSLGYGTSLF